MIPNIEISKEGNISTLYNDDINLYELGAIRNVRRASEIRFNELFQDWVVVNAKTKEVVYQNKRRDKCVEWEIINFAPGGKYYNENN